MKKFEFVEGITVADVAFVANGKDLSELFINSALALTSIMVEDLKKIEQSKKIKISLSASNNEQLLHDFLEELIFLKDAKLLVFSKFELKVNEKFEINAICFGEKINNEKHTMLVDPKAVTWHKFKLVKTNEGYQATVIIDV